MKQALILIDLLNELLSPEGKLSGKGYLDFVNHNQPLPRITRLLEHARSKDMLIVHVRIGFSPDYKEQPKASPLFGHANKLQALQLGSWGTEFHPAALPLPGEAIVTKHRVNAFVGTPLDTLLRANQITHVNVVGCSTDVGMQTTARAAHDLDYVCTVIGDCCIAPKDEDHEQTLRMLTKVVRVVNLEEFVAGQ